MFCPQCSQQQISEDVRFCSRCGFPLGVVSELLTGGGALPLRAVDDETLELSPRQRGIRKGALVMIGAFALALIIIALTLFKEDFFMLMPIPALIFTGGLIRALYGMLLEGRATGVRRIDAPQRAETAAFSAKGSVASLPPMRQTSFADLSAPRANTAEMARPPSVTDHTTKLLKDEAQ
jgi:hypothetical protein